MSKQQEDPLGPPPADPLRITPKRPAPPQAKPPAPRGPQPPPADPVVEELRQLRQEIAEQHKQQQWLMQSIYAKLRDIWLIIILPLVVLVIVSVIVVAGSVD